MNIKQVIGHKIIHEKICVGSSMDWAKKELEAIFDGTVFLADSYSVARGRQGRIWRLYPGQLLCTLVLKPKIDGQKDLTKLFNYLNMALSLGVVDALKKYEKFFNVGIKWPNDFVVKVNGDYKKLGGILIEAVWRENKLMGLIVGIALNGNNKFEKKDELFNIATSLKHIAGKSIDLDPLYEELFLSLDIWYKKWKKNNFEIIFNRWKKEQIFIEKNITVYCWDKKIISGCMKNVDSDGNIILFDKSQNENKVSFNSVEMIFLKE